MKQLQTIASTIVLAVSLTGCLDEHLTTQPPTILTDEQVWADPKLITGVLANFYSRLPDFMVFPDQGDVPEPFTWFDEGIFSGNSFSGDPGSNQIQQYAYSVGNNWANAYALIRDINLAKENVEASTSALLTPAVKTQIDAELRFMRAWVYFDLVRRTGGVPLILEQKIYDFSGDPSYLRAPRDPEAAVYDFIASEMDAIKDNLGNEGSISRATKWTALALKSRAMLYAASIARHNNGVVPALANGEVGIPESRAVEYYQKSLEASREIIQSGLFQLYQQNPNPGQNFYEALVTKGGNPELIWVKDYSAGGGRVHIWTLSIVPPSLRVDALGGNNGSTISVSAQLAETFDYVDGSPGTFPGVGNGSNTAAGQANWIFWDEIDDIFEGKDGRFFGTILHPGGSARGGNVQIQAGVYVWNESAGKYDRVVGGAGSSYSDGELLTGVDGPIAIQSHVGTTGLYPKKYMDPAPSGATAATRSDIAWVRFRLGEIYMNAAEAAFELGLTDEALGYINALRERAGFPPNSLTTLTFDKIVSERWAELAFEEHRFFDLKRWRLAHILWDGSATSTTANVHSLWPFRIVRPGHPDHGKYVYDKFPSQRQTRPRFFRVGNYYSQIPDNVLTNNPLLVPNPFH